MVTIIEKTVKYHTFGSTMQSTKTQNIQPKPQTHETTTIRTSTITSTDCYAAVY